jgi:hypothetical protein
MSVVVTYIRDLMFGSKIDALLAQLGRTNKKIRSSSELDAVVSCGDVSAAVLNLAIPGDDVFTAAELLIARKIPVYGYFPHVETALAERAQRCGITEIHPRGAILGVLERTFGGGHES